MTYSTEVEAGRSGGGRETAINGGSSCKGLIQGYGRSRRYLDQQQVQLEVQEMEYSLKSTGCKFFGVFGDGLFLFRFELLCTDRRFFPQHSEVPARQPQNEYNRSRKDPTIRVLFCGAAITF